MNTLSLHETIVKNDTLIRKQRYLNTISNKKKLLKFNTNPNITNLEQIRISYNEYISLFNQNAIEHNKPIRKNQRIEKYQKKKEEIKKIKEEKLNQINEKKNKASIIIQNFYKNNIIVKIDETAYKNYVKYIIPKTFFKSKYCKKIFSHPLYQKDEKDLKLEKIIKNYYGNEKSYIEDIKNNEIITHMSKDMIYSILNDTLDLFEFKLKKLNYKCMRVFCTIYFECIITNDGDEQIINVPFNMGRVDITDIEQFQSYFYDNSYDILLREYLVVLKINEISMSVLKYDPLVGSNYTPLPSYIKNTNSIINIKNKDEKCFLWTCIASRHLPERDCERVKQYEKYQDEFIYEENDMPMKLNKISKFEKKNNVNVNVFTSEDKETKYPIHLSKEKNKEVINMFFFNNHYSLIKNFSRFCGSSHKYNCPYCLKSYSNTECYKNHISLCQTLNEKGSHIIMPKENTYTKFNDYAKQKKLPVVMYADFESSLENCNDEKRKYITKKHVANSYRLIIKTDLDLQLPLEYSYVGKDTDIHFVQLITNIDKKITLRLRELNKLFEKPILNEEEKLIYSQSNICSICTNQITFDPKNYKVRDHCHFTGKFLGATHNN